MTIKSLMMATAVLALGTTGALAQDCDWKPERAVTYVVPWGAGGGTDANSRMLASMLESHFGVPFNVVNRTGGNGVTGHSAIANAEPDGYTVGAVTVEINTMHHVGLTEMDRTNITPIALVDIVPSSVLVKADSEFDSLADLLTYVKANPGELTASGTSQGGIWHLALAGLLNAEGMDPAAIRWIPSKGAAPAMQELMAGGVDVATPALSEGKALVDAGELKALAYMYDTRMAALPDVPTTKESTDSGWTLAAWISMSGPEGLPANIVCSYEKAALEAFETQEWADFKASRGADVVKMGSAELTDYMATSDEALGETIQAVGLAK
ncbi:tripartite tricarboxylate transporter substrate binding protein [Acuticoccus sp. MNP-M23]|uniref:Bug family tripartite tricarboxylate transporter substrate binding protein n=1 Tax=Acuticoccus sp. MNP-M23 TaxID=3072793 RepID=UPI0028150274|nr:tripartite tricarboxylate transporter substrate binding protein [Acuticoccus sp. MNP-M23]WMS43622.1 tripartite tricarboxylate transporter substrate binding protein [Acuticoccus sp. MNP-M23]